MNLITMIIKPVFVLFRKAESSLGTHTHYLETFFVFLVLSLTAIISGKGWVEWVGVFGVIFTFEYQVLSTYLREHSEARKKMGKNVKSDLLHKEIQFLFYSKEVIWISYFILLGAYSAIVGTIVFICYGIWRKMYRNEYPLTDEDLI